jgi:DNA polymerase delta subunit 3
MLFEFHRSQNARKPGSIHATYLVCGTKRSDDSELDAVKTEQDGDVEMTSSAPEIDSPAEKVFTTTLSLVSETDLKGDRYPLRTYNARPGLMVVY